MGQSLPHTTYPEPDVEAQLLRIAYERIPLSLLITALTTVAIGGMIWPFFPSRLMSAWSIAILASVIIRYLQWATFNRSATAASRPAFWKTQYLIGTLLAGAAWALGPALMMPDAINGNSALFVATLLSVCAVGVSAQASQPRAMLAFILTTMLPSIVMLWLNGDQLEQSLAILLLAALASLFAIGLRSSRSIRDLVETRSQVHKLLDASLDAVIKIDAQGRIIDWNSRAESMFGWKKPEVLGMALEETIVPERHRAAHRNGMVRFLTTREARVLNQRIETTALRRSGEEFAIELAIAPLQAGEACQFAAFISDISERKRGEADLAVSNKRLSALVEAIPDAIFLKDGDGRLLITNEAAKQLFQLHDIPWQNKTEMELAAMRPAFRAAHEACLIDDEKAWRAGQLSIFSEIVTDKNHQTQSFEVRKQPVFAENGQRQALLIIGRNITTQQQAEAELRVAATAFETQVGMTITDPDQIILRINRAFTEITGYSADEVIGQTPHLLSSGLHDEAFYDAMWQSIKLTGAWQGEILNRRKNSEVYPEWLTITAVKNAAAETTHYVATFTDMSAHKAAEAEINELAFFDRLTGLPNRRLFLDRLQQSMAASGRKKSHGALLFIDLDHFKNINDTLGHDIGDSLLRQVAERLTTCIREGDSVARLGGDEFVVLLESLSENVQTAANQAKTVGEKILGTLNQTYLLGDGPQHSTPSIGVALFVDHQENIDDLLKRADLAMYEAKSAGRNTLRFFEPEMQASALARAALELGLREALTENQFVLHYQAQVTDDRHIVGAEALIRWIHPQRGTVPPDEFIPVAEETGLILPLGRWVLETACAQLANWATQPAMAHLTLAVNVSAREFHQNNFIDQVLAALEQTGANPQRLKLELTESLLVADIESVIAKMSALKLIGVTFSLDDFGTGYSSLAYLSRLPLDQLKIDRSFVGEIEKNDNAVAICAATISLAHSLRLKVVAEGVETEAQRYFLNTVHHCDYIQGYLFGRPLPLDAFEASVRAGLSNIPFRRAR
ncbi:MAG: GGDEF domain-containing protein [Betaproteobacteria bacterium HGW-Betaproteobacteria-10]|nr:MAG: GGDEF domain-containing protein [Betaproteobacteria bacterium HGW-Betaproteobacteria-10]